GEWHTHPEINPQPSVIDKKLMYDCIHKNANALDDLFLVIVGMTGELFAYSGLSGHQFRIHPDSSSGNIRTPCGC
ncbi:MAG: hypothetical protein MUP02_10075, partial [Actinobacteria bacterium]|nr:hypothetical protein [Actinomycetota bacterium]